MKQKRALTDQKRVNIVARLLLDFEEYMDEFFLSKSPIKPGILLGVFLSLLLFIFYGSVGVILPVFLSMLPIANKDNRTSGTLGLIERSLGYRICRWIILVLYTKRCIVYISQKLDMQILWMTDPVKYEKFKAYSFRSNHDTATKAFLLDVWLLINHDVGMNMSYTFLDIDSSDNSEIDHLFDNFVKNDLTRYFKIFDEKISRYKSRRDYISNLYLELHLEDWKKKYAS